MKRLILGLILVFGSGLIIAQAQVVACDAAGKHVVARHWDVVLGHQWEMVRDCRHPEWPARARTVKTLLASPSDHPLQTAAPFPQAKDSFVESPAVRAGDTVMLWRQEAFVRMQMSGVAEQAAHRGGHVQVRVIRHNDDGTTSTASIAGTVRAAGEVEMDQ